MVKAATGSRFSHVGHGGRTVLPHHKTHRICITYKFYKIYPPIVAHLNFSHHIINILFFLQALQLENLLTLLTPVTSGLWFRGEVDEDVWDQSHSMS